MTLILSVLRSEVREHLGLGDETSLSDSDRTENWKDADIDRLLNRSFWEISDKFPFRLKEGSITRTLTAGERTYAMPAPYEALTMISIVDLVSGEHTPLDRMSMVDYESQYVDDEDAWGVPSKYVREADNYILWVTPDDVYPLVVKFLTPFDDLSDANDDPNDSMPRVWHEIILYGAIARGFDRQKNPNMGTLFLNRQVRLINSTSPVEAKEEDDSRHAGLDVHPEWNDRRNLW